MPHEAYEAAPILEKLPLQIESIACYDDILLVGTKQGHLLQYKVKKSGDTKFDVSLERSNKAFSKKPITQLCAVPELYILISLSDNVISVHDLVSFGQLSLINKTKGANIFAVDLQKPKSLSGEVNPTLRMCVSVKRKLQLFYWKNRDFEELQSDLSLYDVPKVMSWCKDSICVGIKRDYFMIQVTTGELKELFPLGSEQQEPLISKLDEDRLILGRDKLSIFLNTEGNPTEKNPLSWSEIPLVLEQDAPYIVAVLPKYIEIRTYSPKLLIQSINVAKPKFISKNSGVVYVASATNVWRLASMPIASQIRQLLQNKEFELALKLAEMTDDDEETEKNKRLHNIRNLFAFHLFCQHKFDESLELFSSLGTDPSHVIGLFPNLLPQEFRNQLEYPDKLPEIEGGELEKGFLFLIEYLIQKRRLLMKDLSKEMTTSAIVEGNMTIKSKKQLSQIIDTTLLKCYLQTNEALVASLLRLKDNNCHVEESERVLKKKEKFSELIILYEKKELHQKALSLLMQQAARPDSPLKGHDRTVLYLQHLGPDHLKLIFDYADWVLRKHPEDGLKIFIEDMPEVEALPRPEVLEYLEKISTDLAIPYLEHILLNLNDATPEFHNRLVQLYQERLQRARAEYLNSLPEGHESMEDSADIREYRGKLVGFLTTSDFYEPGKLFAMFPLDGFHEERAILLGKVGQHEQALGIYVHVLHKPELAEKYCKKNYKRNVEGNEDVYVYLLKMYLQPPSPSSLRISTIESQSHKPRINITAALQLMKDHAGKIDTSKGLELLSPQTELKDILTYLENVMEQKASTKRENQVLKSMLFAENLQVNEQKMFYEKVKVVITDERNCRVCKKRIGNSAFARFPNGVIVHFYCCKDPKVCPVELS